MQIFLALLLITIHLCWKANILHLLHVWLQLWNQKSGFNMLIVELFAWKPKLSFWFRVCANKRKRKTEENHTTAAVSLTGSNVPIIPSGYIDTFLWFIAHLEMIVTIPLCRMLSSFSSEELTRKPRSHRASGQLWAGLASLQPGEKCVCKQGATVAPAPPKICQCHQIKIFCRFRLMLMDFFHLIEGMESLTTNTLN